MAVVDWTFYTIGSPALNLVDIPEAPVGQRWLHFDSKNPGTGTAEMVAVPNNPPYPSQGITRGFLRTLISYNVSAFRSIAGLSCMCNSANMLAGEGRVGYSAVLEYTSGVCTIALAQWVNGLVGFNYPVLARSPAGVWAVGTTFALEVQWYLDLAVLNGIVLTVRLGSATDYSDLTPVPQLDEVLSTSNILTNAVAVNYFVLAEGTPNMHVYVDQTSLGTL